MEYKKEKNKKNKIDARNELIELYVNSKTWIQFRINAELKIPNADKFDILACKLWYLKKQKPFQFFMAKIGIFGFFLGINLLFNKEIFIGLIACFAFEIFLDLIAGNVMREICKKEKESVR